MDKKGALYSIFIFLLLISLVLIGAAYSEWFSEYKEEVVLGLSVGNKVSFLTDDLMTDLLLLIDFGTLDVTRENGLIKLRFEELFNSSVDYDSNLDDYEEFIETTYAMESSSTFVIDNISRSLEVSGYNISYVFDSNNLYVYTDRFDLIESINITAYFYNSSVIVNTHAPNNDADTYPWVQVKVFSPYGDIYLNEGRWLNPEQNNARFFISQQAGLDFDVYFHDTPQDGTLRIHYDDDVFLSFLEYSLYDINESIKISIAGDFYIDPNSGELVKFGDLEVYEG
jgi:hypothetical protein